MKKALRNPYSALPLILVENMPKCFSTLHCIRKGRWMIKVYGDDLLNQLSDVYDEVDDIAALLVASDGRVTYSMELFTVQHHRDRFTGRWTTFNWDTPSAHVETFVDGLPPACVVMIFGNDQWYDKGQRRMEERRGLPFTAAVGGVARPIISRV